MIKKLLTIVLAALCLNFSNKAQAQFHKPSEQTIRLGQALPDSFFSVSHSTFNPITNERDTIQLQQFRDQLIILDFWATWCGPCIYSLRKLDTLKQQTPTLPFEVIPVTYQSTNEIADAAANLRLKLVSIVADTLLGRIFPHSGIPHQVWIKDGKVLSIPKWDYATKENILKAIQGKELKLHLSMQDRMVDPNRPLFTDGNGEAPVYYKNNDAVIGRYVPNYRIEPLAMVKESDTTILYAVNNPIQQLFYAAFKDQIFPRFDLFLGIKWEISDSLRKRLFTVPPASIKANYAQDSLHMDWRRNNLYSYNLRHPKLISKDKALSYLQADLRRFFGLFMNLSLDIKQVRTRFLVLRASRSKADAETKLKSTLGELQNLSDETHWEFRHSVLSEQLILALESANLEKEPLLIDRTGLDPQMLINFRLSREIHENPFLANQELAKYGLTIQGEYIDVPVLVVTQAGYATKP